MRIHPQHKRIPPAPAGAQPVAAGREQPRPQDVADVITPFYVADSFPIFPYYEEGSVTPADDGVQLVCWYYVPEGQTGFIKQIRICPYMPPQFVARDQPGFPYYPTPARPRPAPILGYYETPAGWEGLFDPGSGSDPLYWDWIPMWRWHLRYLPGNLQQIKSENRIPPFNVNDPNSWWLVSPYPVPRRTYQKDLPGQNVLGPQKLQRIGSQEDGSLHILVPQDTTILLFAEWNQRESPFQWRIESGAAPGIIEAVGEPVWPLLPSFGALIGYTQPNSSPVTLENARRGWGG